MSSSRIKPNHGGCRLILNSVYSAIWSFPVNKEFVHNWGIQEDKAMTRNKGVITSPSCQMSGLPWKFELSGHKKKKSILTHWKLGSECVILWRSINGDIEAYVVAGDWKSLKELRLDGMKFVKLLLCQLGVENIALPSLPLRISPGT